MWGFDVMRLFSKLFSRKDPDPDLNRAAALLRRAMEACAKHLDEPLGARGAPLGAYAAAQSGAEIRRWFFSFKEDIERGLGEPVIWLAPTEGVLVVHPKLREELHKKRADPTQN